MIPINFFFSQENMPELTDPWGTVTIVLPHLRMESIQALSRLLYCGNSGNLSNVVMEEILSYVRPEFGGFKQNKAPEKPMNLEAGQITSSLCFVCFLPASAGKSRLDRDAASLLVLELIVLSGR